MEHYIATALVQAEPAFRVTPANGKTYISEPGWPISLDSKCITPGYKVVNPDGTTRWMPTEQFEDAHLKLSVNPNLRTSAPSISEKMVGEFIAEVDVQTLGAKTTVVRATLKNGFEIVESSSCVSAANYDENVGFEICMKKIKDKVWFLLGFLLQTAVGGVSGTHGTCEEEE